MLFNKIEPIYFIVSFAIGIFLCYISNPKPEVVVKFPSPSSVGSIVYRDKVNNCFVYKADQIDCPLDKSKIRPQPITLEDYNNHSPQLPPK